MFGRGISRASLMEKYIWLDVQSERCPETLKVDCI